MLMHLIISTQIIAHADTSKDILELNWKVGPIVLPR